MQELYNLIQSLSPNEKRHVVLCLQRFSTVKNNYLKLFSAIEKLPSSSDELIIKKFRKEAFVQHLSVTKHQLFNLILNSMREYYDDHFLDWRLKKDAQQVFVLSSKGLDKAAHKMLKRVKKEALQYENYYVLLDLLNHEKWLFGNRRIQQSELNFGITICEEEELALERLTIIQHYKNIWHQLTFYELSQKSYTSEDYSSHLTGCMQVDIVKNLPDIDSYLIKIWYHSTWAHYYMLLGNTQKHFEHYKSVVIIRDEQLIAQPESPIDLFATYYNFMLACYQHKQWNDLWIYLEKIKKLEAKSIEKRIKLFHDYYHPALLYYLGTQQFKEGLSLIQEIRDGLVLYQNKIRIDFLIWIWQCCGLICFFNKQLKEAYFWWQEIQQLDKTEIEIKIQCSVEIYLLMLTIEEKSFDVFDYQIKQAQNKIKENNLWDDNVTEWFKMCIKIDKNCVATKADFAELKALISENNHSIIDEFVFSWLSIKCR